MEIKYHERTRACNVKDYNNDTCSAIIPLSPHYGCTRNPKHKGWHHAHGDKSCFSVWKT